MTIVKDHWKRYLLSSVVTFLAGFALAVGAQLETLNYEAINTSVLLGLFMVGIRGGVKVLVEWGLPLVKEVKERYSKP